MKRGKAKDWGIASISSFVASWGLLFGGNPVLATEPAVFSLAIVETSQLPTLRSPQWPPQPPPEPPAELPPEATSEPPSELSPEAPPSAPMPEGRSPLPARTQCPADIETLTAMLLRDLPDYTNRVLQRTVAALPGNEVDGREPYRPSHVLIAGRAEFEPLDLQTYALTTDPEAGGPLVQVFFTTLSRQYSRLRWQDVQEYHWLFLARADDGWWPAFIFSALDNAETSRAPMPPRENSQGSVGQAVQLWLRDCRAAAVYPLEPP